MLSFQVEDSLFFQKHNSIYYRCQGNQAFRVAVTIFAIQGPALLSAGVKNKNNRFGL
jgi:hypothetical protein